MLWKIWEKDTYVVMNMGGRRRHSNEHRKSHQHCGEFRKNHCCCNDIVKICCFYEEKMKSHHSYHEKVRNLTLCCGKELKTYQC